MNVSAQVIITPNSPTTADDLTCIFPGANPYAYLYRWYLNGQEKGTSYIISNSLTEPSQQWTCKMFVPPTPYTGLLLIGEASVIIAPPLLPPDTIPVPNFTISANPVAEGISVTFTDLSTSVDPISSWQWDFDNNGIVDTTMQNANYTYLDNGVYTVKLTVTDNDGSIASITKTITVNDLSPVANFSASSYSVLINQTIAFTDLSLSFPDTLVAWNWTFGDGSSATTQNVSHSYTINGSFIVNLTIQDEDGSVVSKIESVIVSSSPDTTPPASVSSLTVSNVTNQTITWTWTNPPNPDFAFAIVFLDSVNVLNTTAGMYTATGLGNFTNHTITVHTIDVNGNKNTTNVQNIQTTLQNLDTVAPVISGVNHSGITNESAVINWTTGEVSNTSVNFGTTASLGTTSTINDAVTAHSRTFSGLSNNTLYFYNVTSCDASGNCATAGAFNFITAQNTAPPNQPSVANASIPAIVTRGNGIKFKDLSFDSDGTIISWLWTFGDGANSTLQNPTHIYSVNGIYAVNLTVVDNSNANSSYSTTIDVREPTLFGTVYDTNTGLLIAGANISFYSNTTCSLDEIELTESGNCSLEPKAEPDAETDAYGNYSIYLPSNIYHMVVQHSKQAERNLFVNETKKQHDPELKESPSKNVNFEGHIIYGGKYRDGNKYIIGDSLDFVMFGVNHEAQAETASFLIERHVAGIDNGANGPWIYNGSFANPSETLTVPANGSKVSKKFNITLSSIFSMPGRYDVHVLMNNSGTFEKWHKIGNFFIMENVSASTRLPPELNLVSGPNFYDLTNDNINKSQYVNQSFDVKFKVLIKPQPETIPGLLFSTAALVDNPCVYASEGDEILIEAPGGMINMTGSYVNDVLKLNVTNARDPKGCYVSSNFKYGISEKYMINISLKERYYGALSPLKYVNVSIWATEQQARDIWYDISQRFINPRPPANFSGHFRNITQMTGTPANCVNTANVHLTESTGAPGWYNLTLDYKCIGALGFEYRSAEEGDDGDGDLTWIVPSGIACSTDPLVNDNVSSTKDGATRCEKRIMDYKWKQNIGSPQALLTDAAPASELADTIAAYWAYNIINNSVTS